jgi:hypothetical protein
VRPRVGGPAGDGGAAVCSRGSFPCCFSDHQPLTKLGAPVLLLPPQAASPLTAAPTPPRPLPSTRYVGRGCVLHSELQRWHVPAGSLHRSNGVACLPRNGAPSPSSSEPHKPRARCTLPLQGLLYLGNVLRDLADAQGERGGVVNFNNHNLTRFLEVRRWGGWARNHDKGIGSHPQQGPAWAATLHAQRIGCLLRRPAQPMAPPLCTQSSSRHAPPPLPPLLPLPAIALPRPTPTYPTPFLQHSMDSRGRGGKVALIVTVRPSQPDRLPHSLWFATKALRIKITVGRGWDGKGGRGATGLQTRGSSHCRQTICHSASTACCDLHPASMSDVCTHVRCPKPKHTTPRQRRTNTCWRATWPNWPTGCKRAWRSWR